MEQGTQVERGRPRVFYGWVIVGVAFAVGFSEGALRNSLLSVFMVPMTDDFGWSRTALTGAISVGAILSSFIAPIVGPILDHRGPRGIIVAGVAITGGALIGLAFVGALWHYYVLMAVARAVSMSAVMLGTTVAVANWFIRHRGRAFAIAGIGARASIPLFIVISQALISVYSWRVAWIAMGIITIAIGILPTLLLMRQRPEDMGLMPDGDFPHAPLSEGTLSQSTTVTQEVAWSLHEAVRTRALWFLILSTSMVNLATQGMNLHAFAALVDHSISPASAAGVVTFSVVIGAVASLVWGLMVERLHVRYTAALMFIFSAIGIAAMVQADSLPMAYAYGFFYGIGFGGVQLLGQVLYADYFGRQSLGAIRGFVQPFNMVTSAAGPVLASLAYDLRKSYSIAFNLFMVSFILAAAVILLATPPRQHTAIRSA